MDEHRTLDDTPADAADALAIIARAQSRAGRLLTPNSAVLYAIWGVAWLVNGTMTWGIDRGWFGSLGWLAGVALAVLLLAGLAVSVVVGLRSTRGVHSDVGVRNGLYAASWIISFVALTLLLLGVQRAGLPEPVVAVLYPGAYVFLAGALYLAAGALWRDVPQYVLGVWTIAVGVVSVFAGHPANDLIMAFGGGGGLLVAAAFVQRRRAR
jgi:hypothetical protein